MVTETTTAIAPDGIHRAAAPAIPFHSVLYAMLATLVFFMVRRNIADPDLWWHLRNAEYVWTHHSFPLNDIYSFSAHGAAWVPHEWLSEMLLYAGYRIAGMNGVFTVTLLLTEAIFLAILYLCYVSSGDIKNSFLMSVLAVMLGTVSIGPRTLLVGWLLLVVLLIVLLPLRRGRPVRFWVIPLLFLLWVNCHGSWVMGMIVFGTIVTCGFVRWRQAQVDGEAYSRPYLRKILITAVASAGALFINPVGYRLLLYPFDVRFRQVFSVNHVQEWASVNFHEARGTLVIGLILAIIAAGLFSRVRWRMEEVALIALALYMSLTYSRMVFLAAILVPPILVRHCNLFTPYDVDQDKPILNGVVVALCLVTIFGCWPRAALLNEQVAKMFPIRTVEYIKAQQLRGNLFNDYLWGGYLVWEARDNLVFVDGRADIYDHRGVFQDYIAAMELRDSLAILDRYQIDHVLLQPDSPLAYLLRNSSKWTLEYSDNVGVLFRRVA